jgi:ketosteroid isomerase-like protein
MSVKTRDVVGTTPEQVTEWKKQIGRNNTRYLKLYKERNMDGIAAMYTPDCRFMPAGFPIQEGPNGISGFWSKAVELGFYSLWFETVELMGPIDNEFACERCRYVFHDDQGHELQIGKYIVVWKNIDGTWKYHWDIWNPDTL